MIARLSWLGFLSTAFTALNTAVVDPIPTPSTITAESVKPGVRTSPRAACRSSLTVCSSQRTPRPSRCSSRYRVRPPKLTRARRRASSAGTPVSCAISSASSARWSRISSSSSRSMASPWKSARVRRARRRDQFMRRRSGGAQHFVHGRGKAAPLCALNGELPSPLRGERVELRAAPFVARPPLRRDPPAILEAIEGRVERPLPDLEHIAGYLAEAFGDSPAMKRPEDEAFEDQKIESTLQQVGAGRHVGSV